MTEDIDELLEKLKVRSSKPESALGSESMEQVIADAIDFDSLQLTSGLFLNPQNEETYTGWAKWVWSNGQVKYLVRFKDGKQDGPNIWWYKNGNKRSEDNWKANRQDGLSITYNEDGTQRERTTWNHGKLMTAVAWRPDGEECPHTNLVKGNGVVVRYNYDGSEKTRFTYQDGELVSQTPINEKSLSGMLDNIEAEDLIEVLGNNSNPYDIDALLGEAEKLSSSREKEGGALPEQLPGVALDFQRQVTPPPAQSALPSSTTGSSEKIRTLAKNHYFGRESAPDYERAFALFTHLANAGDAEAARYLGIAYLRGKGVSKDSVKALKWFRVASRRGDALAAKNVRMLKAVGLVESTPEAKEYLVEGEEKTEAALPKPEHESAVDWSELQVRNGVSYILNTDKPFTGYAKRAFENGQKMSEGNWKDGKQDGLVTKWYKNGRMAIQTSWKDGEPNGIWTEWYENGQKKLETNWKEGKLTDGFTTSWYENGKKKEEINFKDGKRDGIAIYYNEDGTEESRKTFKDDELVFD